jgi:phage shock protein E
MEELIKNENNIIVDVRSAGEFAGGHVVGSINIALNEVPNRIEDFKKMNGEIILCCASGNRSGQAMMFLRQNGFNNVHNGGGWMDVNYYKSL